MRFVLFLLSLMSIRSIYQRLHLQFQDYDRSGKFQVAGAKTSQYVTLLDDDRPLHQAAL